jgi:hypothetical protein
MSHFKKNHKRCPILRRFVLGTDGTQPAFRAQTMSHFKNIHTRCPILRRFVLGTAGTHPALSSQAVPHFKDIHTALKPRFASHPNTVQRRMDPFQRSQTNATPSIVHSSWNTSKTRACLCLCNSFTHYIPLTTAANRISSTNRGRAIKAGIRKDMPLGTWTEIMKMCDGGTRYCVCYKCFFSRCYLRVALPLKYLLLFYKRISYPVCKVECNDVSLQAIELETLTVHLQVSFARCHNTKPMCNITS